SQLRSTHRRSFQSAIRKHRANRRISDQHFRLVPGWRRFAARPADPSSDPVLRNLVVPHPSQLCLGGDFFMARHRCRSHAAPFTFRLTTENNQAMLDAFLLQSSELLYTPEQAHARLVEIGGRRPLANSPISFNPPFAWCRTVRDGVQPASVWN